MQPVSNGQHFDISELDMSHLADSMTAIFEPTNQARSLERVGLDSEVLEEDGDTEVVLSTQTRQVNEFYRSFV